MGYEIGQAHLQGKGKRERGQRAVQGCMRINEGPGSDANFP
jgi:hypothetical protein